MLVDILGILLAWLAGGCMITVLAITLSVILKGIKSVMRKIFRKEKRNES